MTPFPINRTREGLKKQITYVINREFGERVRKNKNFIFILVIMTAALIGLMMYTNKNSLPAVKEYGVPIILLLWMAVIIFSLAHFLNWLGKLKWRNKSIEAFMQDGSTALMEYDADKMVYTSGEYRVEIAWDQYKYFAEAEGCMYFIPEKKPFETMYFSTQDIGPVQYEKLKSLAKDKLIAVD